jgi:5-methylcytosine-specific restriction endonuclease McrA
VRQILANAIGLPCPYCGHPMQHPEEGRRYPTRDHIRPRSKGFTLEDSANRAIVCQPCNGDKGSRSLASFLFRLRRANDARAHVVAAFAAQLVNSSAPLSS